jgi:hypothetical protein
VPDVDRRRRRGNQWRCLEGFVRSATERFKTRSIRAPVYCATRDAQRASFLPIRILRSNERGFIDPLVVSRAGAAGCNLRRSGASVRQSVSCPGQASRSGAQSRDPEATRPRCCMSPGSAAHRQGALRCVRGTRPVSLDAFLHQRNSSAQTHFRILAACSARALHRLVHPPVRGSREDRVPAGTRDPLCEGCATKSCTAAYR